MTETSEMFTGEVDLQSIDEMAQAIAIEDEAVAQLKKEHTRRKDSLDKMKTSLCDTLIEAGMKNAKLDCGLTPSVSITDKFYKAAEVEDATVHKYLEDIGGKDIIVRYVHFGTQQSFLRAFVDGGGVINKLIFNVSPVHTVRMNGKAQFLKERSK